MACSQECCGISQGTLSRHHHLGSCKNSIRSHANQDGGTWEEDTMEVAHCDTSKFGNCQDTVKLFIRSSALELKVCLFTSTDHSAGLHLGLLAVDLKAWPLPEQGVYLTQKAAQ